jgi:hypothetical protein
MKNLDKVITYHDIIALFDYFDMTAPSIWAELCVKTTAYIIKGKQQSRTDPNFTDYYIEDDIEILTEMETAFNDMLIYQERSLMLHTQHEQINILPIINLLNGVGVQRILDSFALMKINIREMLNEQNVMQYKMIAEFIETINMYMNYLVQSHKELIAEKE